MSQRSVEDEHPVAPLELLFDLVFVFAFTQVTTLLTNHSTWECLGQALLIMTALWWAWAAYAWLTNTIDAEVPALGALALVAGVWVALHAYELIWWREERAQLRAHRLPSSS